QGSVSTEKMLEAKKSATTGNVNQEKKKQAGNAATQSSMSPEQKKEAEKAFIDAMKKQQDAGKGK
ncbi:hypothetical protein KKB18_07710, partial [bacterium]|nr:hypothetical protein [bacterium]